MIALRLISLLLLPACIPAAAATYEVLADFTRPGSQAAAAAVAGQDGNFYTVAAAGGANGLGAVLRITPAGAVTTVHSFSGADGQAPVSSLALAPDGSLTGVTAAGGASGFGTMFRISAAGIFTPVLSFTGSSGAAPGSVPQAVVRHPDGNFYGVTLAGGNSGSGTVFRLTSAGVFTSLASFTGTAGAAKGAEPLGPLTISGTVLYGVTARGGAADFGTVFSVTTAGAVTTLTEFTGTGTRPGAQPAGPLLLHTDGAMYGTTLAGGTEDFGTAFRITTAGAFTALRSFTDATGSNPRGALALGADGNLYGATAAGGTVGFGTLYRMTTAGVHTVLGSFTGTEGTQPGSAPLGGLTESGGAFHGVTSAGGAGDLGVVFSLTTAGVVTKLADLSPDAGWMPSGAPVADGTGGYLFPLARGGSNGGGTLARITPAGTVVTAAALGGPAGDAPVGGLLSAGGEFFGVCAEGGTSGRGTAYRFNGAASLLSSFTTTAGSLPDGPLISGSDGALYGPGREGGTTGRGTIYRLTTAGGRSRLVSFTGTSGAARGTRPLGPLALAPNANYYGMTATGGTQDQGTIFRMNAAGILTTLGDFTTTGPRLPRSGLVAAADGFLYGTVSAGGAGNAGALIRLNPSTETWSTVAEFAPAATGSAPAGQLLAAGGAVYGMTTAGGNGSTGTVWKWTPAAGLEALAHFTGNSGAAPGAGEATEDAAAFTGGLALKPDGTLLGVAPAGGPQGGGVVFRITERTPLQSWKLANLGDANAPDAGDPDSDGVPTLMEYALGTLPGIPSTAPISSVRSGSGMDLTATRSLTASGVTLELQSSTTLAPGSWQTVSIVPQVLSSASGVETVRYTLPLTGAGRFYRFVATR